MPIKKFLPITPGTRKRSILQRPEITRSTPGEIAH